MKTLIKGGLILTLDSAGRILETGDLLVDGDKIVDIDSSITLTDKPPDRIIEASGKLVMPGLINAHLHSWNVYLRGFYEDTSLDVLVPYLRNIMTQQSTPRATYVRTMHCALEMLKGGITTAVDILNLALPFERPYEAVMTAYQDIGMRAAVGISLIDRRRVDTVPFLAESLPPPIYQRMANAPVPEWSELLKACEALIDTWHARESRLEVVLAPSGPQRCTDDLMMAVYELAHRKGLSWHMHVLETKTQLVAGYRLYGDSIVSHLRELGLLSTHLTMAHCVWASDLDIELIAESGASVAHNPVSNLKLRSGIAPIKSMIQAGINVSLGCDGGASNDGQNMFEAMKYAALIHQMPAATHKSWSPAAVALQMATGGGARSILLQDYVGSLEIGKKADIIILDLNSPPFIPINDIVKQLVYCECGKSVETVIVNGQIVIEKGRSVLVDEASLLRESHDYAAAFRSRARQLAGEAEEIRPYVEKAYWRSMAEPIPNRKPASAA